MLEKTHNDNGIKSFTFSKSTQHIILIDGQQGSVVKSALIMINMVPVQSRLELFRCVLEKNTLWHCPCLAVLVRNSKFLLYR